MRTTSGNPLPKILSASCFPTLRVGDGGGQAVAPPPCPFFLSEDCRLSIVGKPQNCQGNGFRVLEAHLPMQLSGLSSNMGQFHFSKPSENRFEAPLVTRTPFAKIRTYVPVSGVMRVSSSFCS